MKKIREQLRSIYEKHTPSIKLPMVVIAIVFCMIPLMIQGRVLSSSSRQAQIDRRIIDVQNQCQILSNRMSRADSDCQFRIPDCEGYVLPIGREDLYF